MWAAAVLEAEAAWKAGWKGRGPFGQGVPFGPSVDVEELAGGLVGEGGVPGGPFVGDFVGAALGGGVEGAALGAEEVEVEVGEGGLGEVLEVDVDLAGHRVGGDGAGQLDVDAEAVEGEDHAEAVAGLGFAEVDGAGEDAGEDGGFDGDRADLGVFGALGFFGGAEARLGFRAGGLAVGDVGGEGEASGRVTSAALSSEGEGTSGLSNWGTVRRNSAPEGLSAAVGGRVDRLGGVEGELGAVGGGRPGGVGVGFAAVVGEDVEGGGEGGEAAGGGVLEEGGLRGCWRRPGSRGRPSSFAASGEGGGAEDSHRAGSRGGIVGARLPLASQSSDSGCLPPMEPSAIDCSPRPKRR